MHGELGGVRIVPFRRFRAQPKLFLDGGEDGRFSVIRVGVGGLVWGPMQIVMEPVFVIPNPGSSPLAPRFDPPLATAKS